MNFNRFFLIMLLILSSRTLISGNLVVTDLQQLPDGKWVEGYIRLSGCLKDESGRGLYTYLMYKKPLFHDGVLDISESSSLTEQHIFYVKRIGQYEYAVRISKNKLKDEENPLGIPGFYVTCNNLPWPFSNSVNFYSGKKGYNEEIYNSKIVVRPEDGHYVLQLPIEYYEGGLYNKDKTSKVKVVYLAYEKNGLDYFQDINRAATVLFQTFQP